ncbi:hypothetical protein RF11_08216 [Thelohanellus kitauei]|uniref:Uncharacterized protein n=1 Tax=Thelohanellus kitauei TaxID=669202 RepID=A0A0C2NBW0_THEKT|nr:hypothetical protein RF11_08216 [Thelohanellus kitauei]
MERFLMNWVSYEIADFAYKFDWLYVSRVCKIAYDIHGVDMEMCKRWFAGIRCSGRRNSKITHVISPTFNDMTLDGRAYSSNRYALEREKNKMYKDVLDNECKSYKAQCSPKLLQL